MKRDSEGNLIQKVIESFKLIPTGMQISIATGFVGIGTTMYGLIQNSRDAVIAGNALLIVAGAMVMTYLERARRGYD